MADADLVADVRNRLGVAQAVFATMLGVHPMTVSKWERGVSFPTEYQRVQLRLARTGAHYATHVDRARWGLWHPAAQWAAYVSHGASAASLDVP